MTTTDTGPDDHDAERGARPQALLVPGRHRRGPAHDRARRLGRHRGPALRPARPAHLGGQPAVGHERVHPGLRQPAAARRSDRRLPRPAPDVHRRASRLRCRLGPRRPGPELGHALRGPRPAGRLRRRDGPGGAVPSHRHLHRSPRAGPRLRRLRRHLRRWGRHRPRPGRDPDATGVVAVDPPHQRPHRRSSPPWRRAGWSERAAASRRRDTTCPAPSSVTGGLFLLVYGFTMAGTHGWGAPTHRGPAGRRGRR